MLDRVERGESLYVTRDGAPVAELRPIGRRSLSTEQLIARARLLPKVDYERFRHDIDEILDQSL